MPQFHGLKDAFDDHAGAQTGSQSQEQHCSASIASECLHRRVIDEPNGAPECGLEVEPYPTLSEVPRFDNDATPEHGPGISDGNDVILPIDHGGFDVVHHA